MMKCTLPAVFCLLLLGIVYAQEEDNELYNPSPKIRREGLPAVILKADNAVLMKAFYPEYYTDERNVRRDIQYVINNDSTISAMWDSLGDTTLELLEDLSGIKWRERILVLHLMKYLRVEALYDPLAIPLGGIKRENYTEAAPTGIHQYLNVIKSLAGRMLLQAELDGYVSMPVAGHPLMDMSAYRFDVLALTLTLACAEMIFPADSLNLITGTEQWQEHNPGWQIYRNYFKNDWILSPSQTLTGYLSREQYDSPLIALTRPPTAPNTPEEDKETNNPPVILPCKGRLGFSVLKLRTGLLEVVDIDTLGLAYISGIRIGDRIKRVNGEIARSPRDLMGKILDKLDTQGVYVLLLRGNEELGVLLLPPDKDY
jgi:hypothetical protein